MNSQPAIVVTGATGGIGSTICRTLASEGYAMIAHYYRNHIGADILAREIANAGGACHLVRADLSTSSGILELVAQVDRVLVDQPSISLYGLVNNAAKLLGPAFDEATPEQFDEFFNLNTRAPLFLSQHLSSRMRAGGSIINISSANAHISSPGDIVYAMTKSALESLTKNAAEALAPKGLRINTVIPGFTDNGHPGFQDERILEYMSSFPVLGGIAQSQTVAEAVVFLISEKANRTTGTALDISGGTTLSPRGSRNHSVRSLLSS